MTPLFECGSCGMKVFRYTKRGPDKAQPQRHCGVERDRPKIRRGEESTCPGHLGPITGKPPAFGWHP